MPGFQELNPPPHLVNTVECFWISAQESGPAHVQRILPDGCADIIYTQTSAAATLNFVGPMTRYRDLPQIPSSYTVGIRFRPGMWSPLLGVDGSGLSDQLVLLSDLQTTPARKLCRVAQKIGNPLQAIDLLSAALPACESRSPLQRALAAIEQSHGTLPLTAIATELGITGRHFRRCCREATGLSPKLLSRILRFRRSAALSRTLSQRHAELALECGYADQSHLIADFREFAGITPRQANDRAV